jgi:hypothetical protein
VFVILSSSAPRLLFLHKKPPYLPVYPY